MKEKGRWRGQGRILWSQVANLPDLAVAASFDGWQDYIEIGLAGWQFRELAVAGRIVILTPVAVAWQSFDGWQSVANSFWQDGSFDDGHHHQQQQWQESRNLPATTLCTKFLLCQNPALALLSHRNSVHCVQCVKYQKVRICAF